ncbi:hypothetical protein Q6288_28215, partial [Klebsiella quasipneumoniae]|uniref:hypothetical protein n=1 Tax=Klebsiella quasipneumoniae TaxID=1463165 RepID=UPI00273118CA
YDPGTSPAREFRPWRWAFFLFSPMEMPLSSAKAAALGQCPEKPMYVDEISARRERKSVAIQKLRSFGG